ncbi:D-alanyl-D-alanine carboxypeptidase family protein [Sulfuricurvum sp.]|uniref:D-alanyl-D-alanine carboxypeptidase family protein n=1 Tax=Sulfuricurvum sp. TaxID=2025608 RepID=UPI0026086F85|nr:D-alanyl-D-alanine carboxypeptidase family protein [Sulfuricurvum sp.]MDD3595160.1 D-alanyl-D-alanine carboxypeptidase family protein [Sulfuricurvum sp.]
MDRRAFLAMAAVCSSTVVFGRIEEFLPNYLSTMKAPSVVGTLLDKLTAVQNFVGYVRFNTISFDEMLKIAARCNKPLTPDEIGYIETIFYGDPRRYGFYGERTVPKLTAVTPEKELVYIKKTGHFLLKGAAVEKYETIKKMIGKEVILTSGVRAPVKQMHLFLKKMVSEGGDLRLTSTSIAPPGFTFHSIGDFDIGKVGYGAANFTERFQETDVFKKLYDGGYISIRYTNNNPYGVRYEPWHIKVTGGNETA